MESSATVYLIPNISKRVEDITTNVSDDIYGRSTPDYAYYDYVDYVGRIIHVYIIVIYSVVFLLGTTGNGLVIWFSIFRMKKTVNVVWFLNLAIADFIFTSSLIFTIIYFILDYHWAFGKFICKFSEAVIFLNLCASISLLTVISIDRCISVIFPVWCKNHRTPRLASIVVLCVWIFAFIFSFPYFIFRDIFEANGKVFCTNSFADDIDVSISIHKSFVITRFIILFAIPFSIIILCYTMIVLRIQRSCMITSNKPFKIIIAVIVSFFVCWFPYHVISFLELSLYYTADLSDVLNVAVPLTTSLAFINSCINPVLYVFIGRDFKGKFWSSIQSTFERAFAEDTVRADSKLQTNPTTDCQLV